MYIESSDAFIHCKTFGELYNPPLLLLHGNGENMHYMDSQIEFFSAQYFVIALDSRGHGRSSRGKAPLNFSTMAKDVIEVLDSLQIKDIHILGYSDGGNLALTLALMAPDRVSSLILVGANFSPKGLKFPDKSLISLNHKWLFFKGLFSARVRRAKEIWALMVYYPKLTPRDLSSIQIPTLIITGDKDMIRESHIEQMLNAIQGSRHAVIENAGHWFLYEDPDKLNRIAAEFLQQTIPVRHSGFKLPE